MHRSPYSLNIWSTDTKLEQTSGAMLEPIPDSHVSATSMYVVHNH